MTDTQLTKALQLAELMQSAVQTYPQQSEDEPGGYCTQVDQLLDEAAAELIRLDAREDELLHHVCVLQGMNDESLESIRALTAELEQARAALAAQGEPVARVELITAGGNAGIATRIVEIDVPSRERLRQGTKLYTAPPAPAKPMTDEQVTAAARCLCDEFAADCNVDRDDAWMIHGEEFKESARRALMAAHGITTASGEVQS